MAKSTLISIISILFLWFGTPQALKYGGIWEARTHPSSNVKVKLDGNDSVVIGNLSMQWNGDFLLTTSEGSSYQFTMKDLGYMELPDFDPDKNDSFFYRWRSFFPAAVLMSIHITLLIYAWGLINRKYLTNTNTI
ncbi:hypothetical protein [Cellvibrio sp. KY-GH-1]|uniref:hypothetical protein n=1 Tax=Cellvibrio sp. KY-GH-1 TaxID=2303332 RepID=UPI001244ED1F|nr:hypothetical protein [Cellvibrio sp. KY-GH-1]